jgi:hypothetical protein
MDIEYLVHPAPFEVVKQSLQAFDHEAQVQVMSKLRLERRTPYARLRRIDFPWVEIEQPRLLIASVNATKRHAEH